MHPDLGGGFGTGRRVAYGYDLVGDEGSQEFDGSITVYPDADPRDTCIGERALIPHPPAGRSLHVLIPIHSPEIMNRSLAWHSKRKLLRGWAAH